MHKRSMKNILLEKFTAYANSVRSKNVCKKCKCKKYTVMRICTWKITTLFHNLRHVNRHIAASCRIARSQNRYAKIVKRLILGYVDGHTRPTFWPTRSPDLFHYINFGRYVKEKMLLQIEFGRLLKARNLAHYSSSYPRHQQRIHIIGPQPK
jgi:hypothetical protein